MGELLALAKADIVNVSSCFYVFGVRDFNENGFVVVRVVVDFEKIGSIWDRYEAEVAFFVWV